MSLVFHKNCIVLLVLYGCSWLAWSQGAGGGICAQRWLAEPRHLTVNDGLPTLDTYDIEQDEHGFIWIGTDLGMAKYDGYDFTVMTTRDGLSNNDVIRVYKDRKNRLWLNSLGDIVALKDGNLETFPIDGIKGNKSAFEMLDTPSGGMWFNYGKVIYYLDSLQRVQSLPASISQPRTLSPAAMAKGIGDTIMIYNGDYLFLTYEHRIVDSLTLPPAMRNVRNIAYAQREDRIYFINEQGLQYWTLHSDQVVMQDPTVSKCVSLTFKGTQLFAMHMDYGLRIYDVVEDTITLAQVLRPADYCITHMIDDEGNLWITTLGSGVYVYPPQTLPTYAAILPEGHRRINKLMIYEGELYLGTYNGRIYTFDPERNKVNLLVESSAPNNDTFDRITGMVKLSTGEFLVGKDKGLYLLQGDQLKFLADISVKSLFVDQKDNLLISSQRITVKANPFVLNKWIHENRSPSQNLEMAEVIAEDRSYAAFISSNGTIWMDNTEKGFTSYQGKQPTYWQTKSKIFRTHINEIRELPDSTLVVATQGEGLIFLKNERFWVVDEHHQLPSNIANALYVSGDSLWVATNRGVALISKVDIDRQQLKINVYNRNDGLMTEDIADLVLWKNELMLATEFGLLGLPLGHQATEKIYPKIIWQTMEAGGDIFTPTADMIDLDHDYNDVEFTFSGISYRSQGKLRYSYCLKGYNDEWMNTSSRAVRYHNLSPGEYTFMVRAVDYKSQMSQRTLSQTFRIQPHFTQTNSFLLACGLLSLLLVGGVMYAYAGIRQKNRLATLVREKTADLDAQIAELARSNEELEQFARAASHDLKSPLRNVASFVQLLARRADDRLKDTEKEYIRMAVHGVKRMEQIINDLLQITKVDQYDEDKEEVDFTEIIAQIRRANKVLLCEQKAEITLDTELPRLYFSRINAYQLLQNLIVNAVTYRSASSPKINIGCTERGAFYEFYVRDNGQGIAKEFQAQIFELFQRLHHDSDIPGTGIGLAICKKIVERNGGTIRVVSAPGEGSTFLFTIPGSAVSSNFD